MTVRSKIDIAQITSFSKAGLTIFENFVPLDMKKCPLSIHVLTGVHKSS